MQLQWTACAKQNRAFHSRLLKDGCVRFKEDAILCSIFGCELAESGVGDAPALSDCLDTA